MFNDTRNNSLQYSLQSLKKKNSHEVLILANEVPFNELFAAKNMIQAKNGVTSSSLRCDGI